MITLVLPIPPSSNEYWRTYRGHPVLSARAKVYREVVRNLVQRRCPQPLVGELEYTLHVFRPRRVGDLGNYEKVLSDALEHAGVFVNDSQFADMDQHRWDTDPEHPRVQVEIRPVVGARSPPAEVQLSPAELTVFKLGKVALQAARQADRDRRKEKARRRGDFGGLQPTPNVVRRG